MNSALTELQSYPFEKLRSLLHGAEPDTKLYPIILSIGEPRHPSPEFVRQALVSNLDRMSVYPTTQGLLSMREAAAEWCRRRFNIPESWIDANTNILPVNGTREALFSFTQSAVRRDAGALVLMPNPFYQIYEGAAILAGAKPYYLPCLHRNGYIPDYGSVPADIWERCQVLFICSPGNPTGALTPPETLKELINLADKHDFVIAADECYSELYFNEQFPPPGLLSVCAELGRRDFGRCVVFNSLSKRSNLPGLRSGFVAGDAELLNAFLLYRTYSGGAMPVQVQIASTAAWGDEEHVRNNRIMYREKFDAVLSILSPIMDVERPDGGFYLWAKTPVDDTLFCKMLYEYKNVTVLPGSYLSRDVGGINPGAGRIRLALVQPLADCIEAAERIVDFLEMMEA